MLSDEPADIRVASMPQASEDGFVIRFENPTRLPAKVIGLRTSCDCIRVTGIPVTVESGEAKTIAFVGSTGDSVVNCYWFYETGEYGEAFTIQWPSPEGAARPNEEGVKMKELVIATVIGLLFGTASYSAAGAGGPPGPQCHDPYGQPAPCVSCSGDTTTCPVFDPSGAETACNPTPPIVSCQSGLPAGTCRCKTTVLGCRCR